ncbi:hypothetical protein DBR12_06070 [Acidovorax sp. HMWF029]|nr:hypothetical protein DBR12_06070 [Acidovorax sp. HMWF029]
MVNKYSWHLVAIGVLACGTAEASTLSGVSADGAWHVDAIFADEQGRQVDRDNIRSNVLYRAELTVRPASDKAACPGRVAFDATMPAHYHGMSTTAKVSGAACKYVVSGVYFQMKGAWELYVDLVRGPVVSRATFPIELAK